MPRASNKVSCATMPNSGVSRDATVGDVDAVWSLRSIRWRRVLKYQDWVNVLLTIGFIVGLLVADNAQNTNIRPFWISDASISSPYRGDSTVPYWVAIVVPLGLMVFSFVIGELVLGKRWHVLITSAVASLAFFMIDGISAFIVTGFATQVTKVAVGRYRPDWLSRCQPGGEGSNALVQYGNGAGSNPVCNPAVSEGEIKDGHWSFPSGHTSTVFVFAVYGAVYCTYAFYWRIKQQPPVKVVGMATPTFSSSGRAWAGPGSGKAGAQGWAGRWLRDLTGTLGFAFILVQMGFAWGVGASRITDNKHHPSDVVAGAVLGGAIALLYILRAIPRHRRLDELDEGDAAELAPTPLLAADGHALASASEAV